MTARKTLGLALCGRSSVGRARASQARSTENRDPRGPAQRLCNALSTRCGGPRNPRPVPVGIGNVRDLFGLAVSK